MITLEQERRYLILLSIMLLGGAATKKETLDHLETHRLVRLEEEDLVWKEKLREPTWRSDFGFIRKHLEREGALDGSIRGIWKITDRGMWEFFDLCRMMNQNFNLSFFKVTDSARAYAAEYVGDRLYDLRGKTLFRSGAAGTFRYRLAQAILKRDLRKTHSGCAVCGLEEEALLSAVCCKPWGKSTDSQRISPDNRLLLCSLHGGLYERGLLGISQTGELFLSPKLTEASRRAASLGLPEKIPVPEGAEPYLKWRYTNLFQKTAGQETPRLEEKRLGQGQEE